MIAAVRSVLPCTNSFRVGAMFALANAILFGSVTAVRGMTATESAETLTMYQMKITKNPFLSAASATKLHGGGTRGGNLSPALP